MTGSSFHTCPAPWIVWLTLVAVLGLWGGAAVADYLRLNRRSES